MLSINSVSNKTSFKGCFKKAATKAVEETIETAKTAKTVTEQVDFFIKEGSVNGEKKLTAIKNEGGITFVFYSKDGQNVIYKEKPKEKIQIIKLK